MTVSPCHCVIVIHSEISFVELRSAIAARITKRRSWWSVEKAVVSMREGKRTSLWTSAELKSALFRANTLHNRLFSQPPTVYRGKHVVSRPSHRSYLKANRISKSEGIKKVVYAYAIYQILSKLVHACRNYSFSKWRFFETRCRFHRLFIVRLRLLTLNIFKFRTENLLKFTLLKLPKTVSNMLEVI